MYILEISAFILFLLSINLQIFLRSLIHLVIIIVIFSPNSRWLLLHLEFERDVNVYTRLASGLKAQSTLLVQYIICCAHILLIWHSHILLVWQSHGCICIGRLAGIEIYRLFFYSLSLFKQIFPSNWIRRISFDSFMRWSNDFLHFHILF